MRREEWIPGTRVAKNSDRGSIIPEGRLGIVVDRDNPGPDWDGRRPVSSKYVVLLDEPLTAAFVTNQRGFTTKPRRWKIIEIADQSAQGQLSRAFGLK